jgi:preprotein translocase subunit SecG
MMMFLYFTAIVFFLILCIVLCFVVLIQEGKGGGGLVGIGGGDTSNSLFGAATSDVLKRFTGWLIFFFLASCVMLSLWTSALARTSQQSSNPVNVEEVE